MLTNRKLFGKIGEYRRHLSSVLKSKGFGVFGALGNGSLDDHSSFTTVPIGALEPLKVETGWGHSVVVTKCKQVLVFGRPFDFSTVMRINGINETFGGSAARTMNKLTLWMDKEAESGLYLSPSLMDGLEDVEDVCASAGLTLALTGSGDVYGFGLNRWGQCGSGDMSAHVFEPLRVQGLPPAAAMDCGLQHCLVLTRDGEVFSWGKGNRGQLGDELVDSSSSPVRVLGISGASPIAVSCGFAHSAALTDDGAVWVWGKGMSDRVKEGSEQAGKFMPSGVSIAQYQDQTFPRRVTLPEGRRVMEVVSSIYTLVMRANDGTLWAMGVGEYDRNRVAAPLQVHDVFSEEELVSGKEGASQPFRPARAPPGATLRKGHNRVTLMLPSSADEPVLQVVLHENEAFMQPLDESSVPHEYLLDLSVGWKHNLAIMQQ